MKKLLLSVFLLGSLSGIHSAHAQAALVSLIATGLRLGTQAALTPKQTAEQKAAQQAAEDKVVADRAAAELAAAGPAVPKELLMQRTPADKLPNKAAAQITALENQLESCHAAMLATPTGPICTSEQRTAIQAAAMSVARAQPGWDLHPYQQEMAYYLAEDARRQQAALPAAPVK